MTRSRALRILLPLSIAVGTIFSAAPYAHSETSLTQSTTAQAAAKASVSTASVLPYDIAKTGSTAKKVFAHYFPPYPISLDNKESQLDYYTKNYTNPDGENGKFRSVGGLLRDRPIARSPLTGDYRLSDALTEVKQAQAAGIDGFMTDIMSWSSANWDRTLLINAAATQSKTGFVAVPNMDMTSPGVDIPLDQIAAKLNQFYSSPAAYRLSDGRYMLSSFKAEAKSPQWWRDLAVKMESSYGKRIAFVGVFLDLSDARIAAYAPVSYALSIWGLRTPESVSQSPDKAAKVRRAGSKWMAPIAVQDVRHSALRYAESGNTETLRASWKRALAEDADMVQMITWNDYSESTHFAPSNAHGRAFLDLNGYYAMQFKTKAPVNITGDEVIVSHRIQNYQTKPSLQFNAMDSTLSGTATAPRNTVEVVTILKKTVIVHLRVGTATYTYRAPGGLYAKVVPLQTGTVSAKLTRGTTTVRTVTSPYTVKSTATKWDLQYYAASSRPAA